MDENHDIVYALNTAAQSCPDVLMQRLAREAAAEMARATHAVQICPSLFNLRQLNAVTMRALATWNKIPPLVPPILPAGRMDHRKAA